MLAQELIVADIPPLDPKDSKDLALELMDEFKVSHLCVVDNGRLVGMVNEFDLLDQEDNALLGPNQGQDLIPTFVQPSDHIFDVVKVVNDHRLTVIPVANEDRNFIGNISIAHLMAVIADMPVVEQPGGIIVMELGIRDYSLSEIARLVENNDAQILGSFITSHPDTTKIQLTLKINKTDLQAILKTFDRYDYTITASYDQSNYEEDLKDRFDLLMNYLNM